MPGPFAGSLAPYDFPANANSAKPNFHDGFPSSFSSPKSKGGNYVERAHMNGLFRLATNDLFYGKCGMLNTFDQEFAAKIEGYPKGAVLKHLVGRNLYDVISLVDNNKVDFTGNGSKFAGIVSGTVDGVNWAYANINVGSTGPDVVFECAADFGQQSDCVFGSFTAPRDGFVTCIELPVITMEAVEEYSAFRENESGKLGCALYFQALTGGVPSGNRHYLGPHSNTVGTWSVTKDGTVWTVKHTKTSKDDTYDSSMSVKQGSQYLVGVANGMWMYEGSVSGANALIKTFNFTGSGKLKIGITK